MLHNFTNHRCFLLPLSSGRTLLDRLCLHPASGCTEEKARELCHQMLVQGLLHPFSESAADPFGGCAVSADFDVRPGRTVRPASTTAARLTMTAAPTCCVFYIFTQISVESKKRLCKRAWFTATFPACLSLLSKPFSASFYIYHRNSVIHPGNFCSAGKLLRRPGLRRRSVQSVGAADLVEVDFMNL